MKRTVLILLRGEGLLLSLAGLFVWARCAEGSAGLPSWAACYLDDLLCLPLVLGLVLTVHRLAGRPVGWTLPRSHGLSAVLLYALYFELVLPLVKVTATADPRDVLAYAAGWAVFEAGINRPGTGLRAPQRSLAPSRVPVDHRA